MADEKDHVDRDQAKADALAQLEKLHIQGRLAVQVVEMLTEAMGWNREKTAEDYYRDGVAAAGNEDYD